MAEITLEFVRRALGGDRRAARELAETMEPVVRARAARMLLRFRAASRNRDVRQEVADVVQHVLVSLYADGGKALRSWDPARGRQFLGFVALVTEREVYSLLRGRRLWAEDPVVDDVVAAVEDDRGSGLEQIVASREVAAVVLDRVLAEMTERACEMFQFLVVDERPVEEIAEITGLKPSAIYVWRGRVLEKVRAIAEEVLSDPAGRRHLEGGGG